MSTMSMFTMRDMHWRQWKRFHGFGGERFREFLLRTNGLTKAFQEVLMDQSKASIVSTAGGSSEGDAWRGHAGLAGPVNLKLLPPDSLTALINRKYYRI